MKAKLSKLNLCLCGLMTVATLTLSACTSDTQTQKMAAVNAFGPITLTTEEYQQAYEGAAEEQTYKALVLLTRSQIVNGDLKGAAHNLAVLDSSAKTAVQKDEATLVRAMYLAKQGKNQKALETLGKVNYKALPRQDISYFLILNSNVNAKIYNQTHDAKYQVNAYKSKATLLNVIDKKDDRKTVINQCNELLKKLDEKTLGQYLAAAQSDLDKGFLEYAIITKSSSEALQDAALKDFSVKHPTHPINELLAPQEQVQEQVNETVIDNGDVESEQEGEAVPVAVPSQALFDFNDGDTIAVMLPLSGRFAKLVGEPAKLGILASLKDKKSTSKVIFYDTNKTNISDVVAKVQNDGTKLVIGPILKPEVTALNSSGLKVPSIVLNYVEGNKPVNQWYFDLGPNYEGAIAASKIFADGYKAPIVIAKSNDTSSQRAAQSFRATLQKGKKNAVLCQFTDAATAKSELNACPFDKADAAYVNASVVEAVNVKAAIPSNVAVYLTDKSYMGINNSAQEFALSGAMLGDMPWLLTDSALKASFMQSLPKANNQVQRVFAAAYDSVNFALNIKKLAANKDDVLHGLSGDISLGENGLIESTPMWVKLGKLR